PARAVHAGPWQWPGAWAARTTARTPGVAPASWAASMIASNMARSSALCLSGRASVTVATLSAPEIRTRSSFVMRRTLRGYFRRSTPVRARTGRRAYERRAWWRVRCSLRLDVVAAALDVVVVLGVVEAVVVVVWVVVA